MTPEELAFFNELHKRIVGAVETGFSSVLQQQQQQQRARATAGSSNHHSQMARATHSLENLDTTTRKVTKTFSQLHHAIRLVNTNFKNLSGSISGASFGGGGITSTVAHPPPPPPPPPPRNPPVSTLVDNTTNTTIERLQQKQKDLFHAIGLTEWSFLGQATKKLGTKFGILASTTVALTNAITNIGGVLVEGFQQLSARGIDTSSQLLSLSKNALLAGMSLTEYLQMVDESAHAIVRFSSFKEFNNTLEVSSSKLAALGVFGATARQVSAQMVASATSLGLPQATFGDVMTQQIHLYEQLRDSTLMLPEAFGELLKSVSANENVQQELQGLAPKERAARYMQLVQISALGNKMGLAAEQAKELATTLLSQRKASTEERFKAAAAVRMAAGFAGLSASEGEELARFNRMKNVSALSEQEQQRYIELSGAMEHGLQALLNTGQIGSEFIGEQLQGMQASHQRQLAEVSGRAKTTVESADVKNTKEFGTEVGKFGQAVGKFMETVSGLNKSKFWSVLQSTTSLMLDAAIIWKLIGVSGQLTALAGAAPAAAGIMSTITTAISGGMATLKVAASGIMSTITTAISGGMASLRMVAGTAISAIGPALSTAFSGLSIAGVKTLVSSAFKATGVGFLIGVAIDFLYNAIGEIFTGTISAAFSPTGERSFLPSVSNIIYAGVTGVVTSITSIIDWVFGSHLTIKVEESFARLRAVWTEMISDVFASIASIMPSILPGKDTLQNWSKEYKQASEAAYNVTNKLATGEAKSIAEIGENAKEQSKKTANDSIKANKEAAEKTANEAAKSAKQQADQTRSAIRNAYSDAVTLQTLGNNVSATARAAQSTLTSSAQIIPTTSVSPAPTPPPQPVNVAPVSLGSTSEKDIGAQDTIVNVLTQSLAVQKKMVELLTVTTQKEPMVVQTVNKSEPRSRLPTLPDNVDLATSFTLGNPYRYP